MASSSDNAKPLFKIGCPLFDEVTKLFYQALSEGYVGHVNIIGRVLDTFKADSIGGPTQIENRNEIFKEAKNQLVTAAIVFEAHEYMLKSLKKEFPPPKSIIGKVIEAILNVLKLHPDLSIVYRDKCQKPVYQTCVYDTVKDNKLASFHQLKDAVYRRLLSLQVSFNKFLHEQNYINSL